MVNEELINEQELIAAKDEIKKIMANIDQRFIPGHYYKQYRKLEPNKLAGKIYFDSNRVKDIDKKWIMSGVDVNENGPLADLTNLIQKQRDFDQRTIKILDEFSKKREMSDEFKFLISYGVVAEDQIKSYEALKKIVDQIESEKQPVPA